MAIARPRVRALRGGEMTLRRAAIGIERSRGQAPTRPARGRYRKASVVQARLDNLIERGTDPMLCRLFIVDGSKAVIKAIRRTFGRRAPISGAQTGTCAEADLQRYGTRAPPACADGPNPADRGAGVRGACFADLAASLPCDNSQMGHITS